jgi:hypothetical protein
MAALALAVAITGGGFELPDYRGSHYTAAGDKFLTCVALRESSGRWAADGPYGSGAFQMVQGTWDHYAARAGYPEWVGKRAAKAPPYVQTEVAFVMVNPYPKRKGLEGAHHWSPRHALTVGKTIRDCR